MQLTAEQLNKLLVGGEFLTKDEFAKAKTFAANKKIDLASSVVELGYLSDAQVGALMAGEKGLFFADLTREKVDHNALLMLPEKTATSKRAVAYKRTKEEVWVAMEDVDDYEFELLMRKKFKMPVKMVFATKTGIEAALKAYRKDLLAVAKELVTRMAKKPHEEDVVKLVELLLASAQKNRASDIHIEPEENDVVVRFRIDGSLHEILRYANEFHEKVVFRIKILARMRTDEHAQAQDGRFEMRTPDGQLNLRVSILPITHGENVVMRLLSESFQRLRLEDLGLQPDDLIKVERAAAMPHGMIMAAGPTGSGKTTTLYAILHILNQPDVNVMTIEDPVEYNIAGIRQIQVNLRTNLTYEAGLKSVVRQDPDVIMVGEVRDSQTASIAVNAAMTGHLLLSTIHANDSATTFPRLYEMGVEPFLVASSVNIVIAQRLVRKTCTHCVESFLIDKETREAIESDPILLKLVQRESGKKDISKIKLYHGRGCEYCGNIGYTGRMGIFEIMEVGEDLRPLIVEKVSSDVIRHKAIEFGMHTMIEDGIIKVFKGLTTMQEIIRAIKV